MVLCVKHALERDHQHSKELFFNSWKLVLGENHRAQTKTIFWYHVGYLLQGDNSVPRGTKHVGFDCAWCLYHNKSSQEDKYVDSDDLNLCVFLKCACILVKKIK